MLTMTKRRRLARSSRVPRDMRPVSASVAVTTVKEVGWGEQEVRSRHVLKSLLPWCYV